MKEGINLAPSSPSENISEAEINAFQPKTKLLIHLSIGLAVILILVLLLNILLALLQNRVASQKSLSSERVKNLDRQEKIILSVVKGQSDLEYVQSQKLDFTSLINVFKLNLPEDTILTKLDLSSERVETSAKTPTGLSFAQFLNNLQNAKICRELQLTRSVFVERQNSFDYSLKCLLKTSVAK